MFSHAHCAGRRGLRAQRIVSPSADLNREKTMTQKLWTAVDDYINQQVVPSDLALDAALAACAEAELPAISVTPSQGKLLQMLALLVNARNILEIGTLGGYSTIWMARALP